MSMTTQDIHEMAAKALSAPQYSDEYNAEVAAELRKIYGPALVQAGMAEEAIAALRRALCCIPAYGGEHCMATIKHTNEVLAKYDAHKATS